MFQNENTSTFAELLQSIEWMVENNATVAGILKDINDLSIGLSRQPTKTPALYIYPIREEVKRVYSSNNFLDVTRRVRFEVEVLKGSANSGYGIANGLTNTIRNLFTQRSNVDLWRLKKVSKDDIIVFNTKVNNIRSEEAIQDKTDLLCSASTEIDFDCQVKIDDLEHAYSPGSLKGSDLKETIKTIYSTLKYYKDSYLNEVNYFKYGYLEPVHSMPAVTVTSDNASILNKSGQLDLYSTNVYMTGYSKLYGGIDAFYRHLTMMHKVRNIMFANKYLLNKCYDYDISTIDYGIQELGNDLALMSRINIIIESFDSL